MMEVVDRGVGDDGAPEAPEEAVDELSEIPSKSRRGQRTRRISGIYGTQPVEPEDSMPKPTVPVKRRCNLKPKKNLTTITELENYFCNVKYKAPTLKSLETVYEEPVLKKGQLVFLGPVKQRRLIFNGRVTKEKLKKRKIKVKNMKNAPKKKRITMDAFLKRLNSLTAADPGSNTPDVLANLLTSCQLTANV